MTGSWGHAGMRCKIKLGWVDAGREGDAICFFDECMKQTWVVVKWDGEEDPDVHKAAGLLIKHRTEKHWRKELGAI